MSAAPLWQVTLAEVRRAHPWSWGANLSVFLAGPAAAGLMALDPELPAWVGLVAMGALWLIAGLIIGLSWLFLFRNLTYAVTPAGIRLPKPGRKGISTTYAWSEISQLDLAPPRWSARLPGRLEIKAHRKAHLPETRHMPFRAQDLEPLRQAISAQKKGRTLLAA